VRPNASRADAAPGANRPGAGNPNPRQGGGGGFRL
jgi:hypothetical protein